jgi:hypothetical protein
MYVQLTWLYTPSPLSLCLTSCTRALHPGFKTALSVLARKSCSSWRANFDLLLTRSRSFHPSHTHTHLCDQTRRAYDSSIKTIQKSEFARERERERERERKRKWSVALSVSLLLSPFPPLSSILHTVTPTPSHPLSLTHTQTLLAEEKRKEKRKDGPRCASDALWLGRGDDHGR